MRSTSSAKEREWPLALGGGRVAGFARARVNGLAGILVAGNVIDSDAVHGLGDGHDGDRNADTDPARQRRSSERGSARSCSAPGRWASSGRSCSSRSWAGRPSATPSTKAVILVAFIALAVFTGIVAVRSAPKGWGVVERTLEASGQLGVRLAVVLIFGLRSPPRLRARPRPAPRGLRRGNDHPAGTTRAGGRDLRVEADSDRLRLPHPVLLRRQRDGLRRGGALPPAPERSRSCRSSCCSSWIIRGVPALLFVPPRARRPRPRRARLLLRDAARSSSPSPRSRARTTTCGPSTATALVGAAIISTLLYPLIGLRLRRRRALANTEILEAV